MQFLICEWNFVGNLYVYIFILQNESFPSHAQVANNPDHCLVPHNINNKQSNTQGKFYFKF